MKQALTLKGGRWGCMLCIWLLAGCAADHRGALFAEGPGAPRPIAITPQLLSTQHQERAHQSGDALERLAAVPKRPYKIGPGDVLSIIVWEHPELSSTLPAGVTGGDPGTTVAPANNEFLVDTAGQLQFPYAGSMPVAGLTPDQARRQLSSRLARYFRDPRLTLRVRSYRSQRVYVGGEVKQPGQQAIDDSPMSLLEALSRAGGLLPSADQSRILLERDGVSHRIDLIASARGANTAGRLQLLPGDIVRATPRDESKVFVSGEVLTPRALPMHDGRLTLNEALGEVGGINPQSGDARHVYIVRRSAGDTRVYQLDASTADAMALAEQFELSPKDVVYVGASSLANWHRAISLLFPGELSSAVGAARP
jgi:polysaccharide export outer membrane protein